MIMTTTQVVRKVNSYYLSPVYGTGQLTSREVVAGPFPTLTDAYAAQRKLS